MKKSTMKFTIEHDTDNNLFRVEVWFGSQCVASRVAHSSEELQAITDDFRDLIMRGINVTVRDVFTPDKS